MNAINQKEYLRKYLSKDGKKKKKKKIIKSNRYVIQSNNSYKTNFKRYILCFRLTIIDDDNDVNNFTKAVKEDLMGADEDAPQIVGIVDDRPLELKVLDYQKTGLWKPAIVDVDEYEDVNSPRRTEDDLIKNVKQEVVTPPSSPSRNVIDDDMSPPRRRKLKVHEDSSPPRKRTAKPQNIDNDLSPPRHIKREDSSPPRRDYTHENALRKNIKINLNSSTQKSNKQSGRSPIRKKTDFYDEHSRTIKQEDLSPPRRSNQRRNSDLSPPRRRPLEEHSSKRHQSTSKKTSTPPRSSNVPHHKSRSKSRWGSENITIKSEPMSEEETRLTKTLDGKRAGLQNANELVKETQEFKKREDDLFKKMSSDVTGVNAVPIMRDRKTGRKRNLQEEAEQQKEKQKIEAETKEKYDRWGKGLKQVEDYNEKLQNDLHEMNKPLARYADDEDLEKYLKEQEREGDPMLEYMRKKKKKIAVKEGKPGNFPV